MEHINPYAVMRNTATHEAYKAYNRKAFLAGQPYVLLATALASLAPGTALIVRDLLHRPRGDLWIASGCYTLPITLAAILMIVGLIRIRRFKKANPIPDEWRQVPRI